MQPSDLRVLVLGDRSAVRRALTELSVPFVVWSESKPKGLTPGVTVHVAPFGRNSKECRTQAEALRDHGDFTHVIASTEAAVVAATHARRVLGARQSPITTADRCHDKLAMKKALAGRGVPMTDFADGNQERDWKQLHHRLGPDLVIKNRRGSGGAGIDIVRSSGSQPHVQLRNRIVERFVDAPEASVESFVINRQIVFENVTEYYRKRHINIVPAPETMDSFNGVRQLNRTVIQHLRVAWGMTHVETFLTKEGPLFGEVALRPPGGYIMELLRLAYGFSAWRAFVAVELGLPFEFPDKPVAHAAAIVLHPGAGHVRSITGLELVREHPLVEKMHLRAKVGQQIEARSSVGKDVGCVLMKASDRTNLLSAIHEIEDTLKIEID